jgi:hypothetical protein
LVSTGEPQLLQKFKGNPHDTRQASSIHRTLNVSDILGRSGAGMALRKRPSQRVTFKYIPEVATVAAQQQPPSTVSLRALGVVRNTERTVVIADTCRSG